MRVGIIQSNYLPWRGYLDLIDDCDLFIFHDDLQYTKGDWRNRNRIKTAAGTKWLTVPVHYRHTAQLICETAIDHSQKWAESHINQVKQHYGAAPYFHEYGPQLFDLLKREAATISELNVALLQWLMAQLGISTELRFSSEFAPRGTKTARLVGILSCAGASCYLSGPTAKSYLDVELLYRHGIGVEYKTYDYAEYPQLRGAFVGDVSVIDLLFNAGPRARDYLKSRTPAEQAA